MHITIRQLKSLLREGVTLPLPGDDHQHKKLRSVVIPALVKQGAFDRPLGKLLGGGMEGCAYQYGDDQVVKIMPMWEDDEEGALMWYEGLKEWPSGGPFVVIHKLDLVHATDPTTGETYPLVINVFMESLDRLSRRESQILNDVVDDESRLEEVEDPKFREFLRLFLDESPDPQPGNAMKRGDEYVIIDPQ